jgi:hypothetical protein
MDHALDEIKELKRQLRLSRFSPRKKEMDTLRRENLQLSLYNQRLIKERELLQKAYDSLLLKAK